MKQTNKEYPQPFLVEPTKLRRIVDLINERFRDHHADVTIQNHFEVFMSGHRRDEFTSLDNVLALENSRNHRIQRLFITSSAITKDSQRPEYEVNIDFGALKTHTNVSATQKATVISIDVRSDSPAWNSRTLSEVEEQIERTYLRHSPSVVTLAVLLILIIVIGFFQFVRISPNKDLSRSLWLSESNLDEVEKILSKAQPLSDEEAREISTMQLQNMLAYERPKDDAAPGLGLGRRAILLGIPLLVLIICTGILLITCYPSPVFLWGDEVDRYDSILQRRKILWNIILTSMLLGVVVKLFSEGVLSFVPKG